MISKEDALDKLNKLFSAISPSGQQKTGDAIQDFLKYLIKNYEKLDIKAKDFFDKVAEDIVAKGNEQISKMHDSKEKRYLIRELSKVKGEHFNSDFLIKLLEKKTHSNLSIIKDTRKIFTIRLQNILDFLFDESKKSHKGLATFAKIGLFYLCVDELLSAFHLAQHSFINQTYTHIRSIWENIDKVELFNKQPEYAELWFSEDPKDKKKIRDELSPASVREKLGKDRYDPIYGMFSELGPHGSLRNIQSRSAMKVKNHIEDKTELKFWFAGCPFEHQIIWVNSFLIITLGRVLLKTLEIYTDNINMGEAKSIILEFTSDIKIFLSKHFLTWASKNDLDIESFNKEIDNYQKISQIL